jgi:hypothetical protein
MLDLAVTIISRVNEIISNFVHNLIAVIFWLCVFSFFYELFCRVMSFFKEWNEQNKICPFCSCSKKAKANDTNNNNSQKED